MCLCVCMVVYMNVCVCMYTCVFYGKTGYECKSFQMNHNYSQVGVEVDLEALVEAAQAGVEVSLAAGEEGNINLAGCLELFD